MFQVWLASSLLVDSLAVAAQTLIGSSFGADKQAALQVIRRVLLISLGLGAALAAMLLLGKSAIPRLFTREASTAAAAEALLPIAALSQPLNALAFAWDGIMFGAGGFRCDGCRAVLRQITVCRANFLLPVLL